MKDQNGGKSPKEMWLKQFAHMMSREPNMRWADWDCNTRESMATIYYNAYSGAERVEDAFSRFLRMDKVLNQ